MPGVAVMLVGAPGTPSGVTASEFPIAPLPAAFTARTRRITVVPFVMPVKVWLRAVAATLVQDVPSLLTRYPVIVAPPLLDGTCQVTLACPLLVEALTLFGALGTVLGVTDGAVAIAPLPTELTARTRSVTAVPFVKPENV